MIARVKGRILEINDERVVVDVGGVCYEVLVPQPILQTLSPGSQMELLTYHLVRENSQELYGFDKTGAKRLFEMLLSVSGIGPKSALAIMSLGDEDRLRAAIAGEDVAFLAAANGVGKKSAERTVIELKDKVDPVAGIGKAVTGDDAAAALVSLGYNQNQAAQALSGIEPGLPTETRVKEALKKLS